uniref:Uncharacterized protein n=1 Tax=Tanacetum cinerariifolium TaxID=118510 RepID=A0A699HTS8_TANCI|nr:hypothetical protein [Tanacetum cinerariifolium]
MLNAVRLHMEEESEMSLELLSNLNGDSPVPTRVVDGVLQPVAPTTAEQKLARKNELKACGTLLMALPNKHQLKFNSRKDAKTLMEAIEKRFGGNTYTTKVQKTLLKQHYENFTGSHSESLDQIHDRLQKLVSQLEIHEASLSQEDVNLKFLRSLPFKWKTRTLIWRNKADLEEQSLDDLKGYFVREYRSPRDSRRNGAAEPQRRTVPVEASTSTALVSQYLESVEARLLVYKQNEYVFEENIKLLNLESPSFLYDRFQPSDGYHVVPTSYTGTFMPPKPDLVFNTAPTTVETCHSTFTVQLSPTKPNQDLSHPNRPSAPIIEDWVSDSKDEFETKAPQIVPSFVQSAEQVDSPRHSVQHAKTSIPVDTPKPVSPKTTSSGKRKNRKTCFVCKSLDHLIKDCDYHAKKMAQPTPRNHAHRANHKQYDPLTHQNPYKHMVPAVVLTQSKPVSIPVVRLVSADVPNIKVTRPRHATPIVTKTNSPIRRHLTCSLSFNVSNSPPRVTVVKAPVGNPQHALKDKGVIDRGSSRHMTGNMSYLFDFEKLNGGYVAFGGNPKSGKISGKGKIRTGNLVRGNPLKFLKMITPVLLVRKARNTEPLGIKREFSVPRTPQQNGTAERKNRTLIEAARTITPSIGFMRPFGCPVTILNTLDSLGKFDGKINEGFLVGYSVSSKAFRVFNSRTHLVQETLHVNFLENKPNIAGSGPICLFDVNSLTKTMNYQPVNAENQPNSSAGFQNKFDAEKAGEEIDQQYVLFPVWSFGSTNPQNNDRDDAFDGKEPDFDAKKPESEVNVSPSSSAQSRKQDNKTKKEAKEKSPVESFTGYRDLSAEFKDCSDNNINEVNAAGTIIPTVGKNSLNSTNTFSVVSPSNAAASPTYGKSSFLDAYKLPDDPDMPELKDITYSGDEDDVGAEADFNNLETSITVSPIPTTRVHKDLHVSQIISDLSSTTQTRSMTRVVKNQGRLSQMFNDDFHTCMFACFLSHEEPKRVHQALKDLSWIEAIQEELLQFKMQKVWVLVDLPHGKRAIGTKWVFRNKKDKRGIVIRNKARVVAQGHTQEERIDYEEVFAPVARIEAIILFLDYASFMGFMVYQMDVKSAFLYGTIEKEVYVCQPPGFEDPDHLDKVYTVVKALYGLHQAPRAWYETLAKYLMENGFQRGKIDQTVFIKRQKGDILLVQIYVDDIIFVKQKKDGIFISQDKYVAEILRKFGLTEGKSAITPIDTEKPLPKDPDGKDVDVHTYSKEDL